MLEYIQKDILQAFREGEFNILLHQTNCVTKARVSGIAKLIFDEYPICLETHLSKAEFANYSWYQHSAKQHIINCNSQYYPGSSSSYQFDYDGFTMPDNFQNRLNALSKVLYLVNRMGKFGIPLIASGIGADLSLKRNLTDLEYFKKFIAPTVEKYLPNCKVYYL